MAVTDYFVDPGGGNDTTGNGTIGTPWATVQKALNTITRNATDGDRINVKAGTADVLGATLSYTTYGTPDNAAPLVIQGYTSSAGDGGIGEISGADTYGICTAWANCCFADMKLGNCGSVDVLDFATLSSVVNCELHHSSGYAVDCGTYNIVTGCWLHDLTGFYAIDAGTSAIIAYNYINCQTTTAVIYIASAGVCVIGNIILCSGADTTFYGIRVSSYECTVVNNSLYCGNANTGSGIFCNSYMSVIANNIVEGWSGAGGDGIETNSYNSFIGANAVYNCTNTYTLNAAKLNYAIAPNDTLGASPFTDAANGDFDINGTVTGVTEDAYPVGVFRGNSSVNNKMEKGAVQAGAGTSSGGGGFPILGGSVVR